MQTGGVPIIIGGLGKIRTPDLAARYAAEFNAPLQRVDDTATLYEAARLACRRHGRDPDDLVLSAAQTVCLGKDDATVRRRAEAIGRDLDELRNTGLAGSPDEIVDKINLLASLGTERVYLQVLDSFDLDHLADIATTVLPQLA